MTSELMRCLPAVDAILGLSDLTDIVETYRREYLVRWINSILDDIRQEIRANHHQVSAVREDFLRMIQERLQDKIRRLENQGVTPVINAAGVVIHTNLGRSPLADQVLRRLAHGLAGYTDVEYDLAAGRRGHRDTHAAAVLRELMECEDATAVNNNAGAVFLILHALARGGEVIVSRSELVEIGGSFRIPDIMRESGAILKEVGTTNKTYARDFEQAISDQTRLILHVHQSNFALVGFTAAPSLEELVSVARRHDIPLVVDAGSGYLFEIPDLPLHNEPVIRRLLDGGVDLVCFSADKLMGGPQAGLILGRRHLVQRIREDPLMRVLRLDKVISLGLTETLKLYFRKDFAERVPIFAMMRLAPAVIRARCSRFRTRLLRGITGAADRIKVRSDRSVIGGGTTPGEELPGYVVVLRPSGGQAHKLERFLRQGRPPVIARTEDDELRLDLRTVTAAEEKILLGRLREAFQQGLW
ncbi:MAG: L-seryl-tRNA(Sec) selenium transferase [Acidobacteria bacterium]|nr:L-seryl-tRNA(Sec) selenium transferase [Acidobacteriota bacterium]